MAEWAFVEYNSLAAEERSAFSMGPFGSKITKDNYVTSGIPVVRGVNLARGVFVDDDFVFITADKADEIMSANVEPGDLIFTHRGTIGQVSMIPRKPRFDRYVIGSSQVKARLDKSKAVPEFYYYWFQSTEGQRSILANASTVGVPGIATPLTSIRKLKVPLPNLSEQQVISTVLGALDDKIVVNERIAETALELARCIYSSFAAGAYTCSELGKLVTLKYGKALRAPDRREGATPVYGCTGQVGWHDTSLTLGPTPVVGRKGANAGCVSWSPKPCWVIDTAFFVEVKAGFLSPEVTFLMLETANLPGFVGDSAVPGINREVVHRLLVKVPEPETAAEVSERVHPLMARVTQAEQESSTLAALRDTLLPQLMSGKLRVRDAERIVEDAV